MEEHKTKSANGDFRGGGPPLKPADPHFKFSAFCCETYGALGPDAQALITDVATHTENTAACKDFGSSFGANWAAPGIATISKKQL